MSFWCILVWSCCMRSLSHPLLVFAYSPFQRLPGMHNRSILSTEQPIVATNLLNPQSPRSVSVDQPHPPFDIPTFEGQSQGRCRDPLPVRVRWTRSEDIGFWSSHSPLVH